MAGNWGLGVSDLSALFTQGDFDGDGMVSSGDLALLSLNFNTNLQNTWLLADFDGDFDVDDDDLAVISANAGMTGATWEDGDLNGDGEVTVEDFDLALALFGLDLELVRPRKKITYRIVAGSGCGCGRQAASTYKQYVCFAFLRNLVLASPKSAIYFLTGP